MGTHPHLIACPVQPAGCCPADRAFAGSWASSPHSPVAPWMQLTWRLLSLTRMLPSSGTRTAPCLEPAMNGTTSVAVNHWQGSSHWTRPLPWLGCKSPPADQGPEAACQHGHQSDSHGATRTCLAWSEVSKWGGLSPAYPCCNSRTVRMSQIARCPGTWCSTRASTSCLGHSSVLAGSRCESSKRASPPASSCIVGHCQSEQLPFPNFKLRQPATTGS